jgi:hypothetical protein
MLDDEQLLTLQAVVNTIIPPDDFPAGWEAGVGDYILGQLSRDLQSLVPQYQQWLSALYNEACYAYGKPFDKLSPDVQAALLQKIEQGHVQTYWRTEPAPFFELIVQHCAEGFYSNPENGGNQDGIAWQMIGFEVRG